MGTCQKRFIQSNPLRYFGKNMLQLLNWNDVIVIPQFGKKYDYFNILLKKGLTSLNYLDSKLL